VFVFGAFPYYPVMQVTSLHPGKGTRRNFLGGGGGGGNFEKNILLSLKYRLPYLL